MSKKLWSRLPAKSYSVNVNGQQLGLGMREIWDQVPGAWNILQLTYGDECEALLNYSGEPAAFPYDCGMVPFAVGMALQMATPMKTWGNLAEELTPAQFLKAVKDLPDGGAKLIMPMAFGHMFWAMAEANAMNYAGSHENVVHINFGGKVH